MSLRVEWVYQQRGGGRYTRSYKPPMPGIPAPFGNPPPPPPVYPSLTHPGLPSPKYTCLWYSNTDPNPWKGPGT